MSDQSPPPDSHGGFSWVNYAWMVSISLVVSTVGTYLAPNKYQAKQDQILGEVEKLRREVQAIKEAQQRPPK